MISLITCVITYNNKIQFNIGKFNYLTKEKISICRDCVKLSTDKIKCHKCNSPRILKHDELLSLNIAHIDCDAFYASVEKSLNPQLINKPVIVDVKTDIDAIAEPPIVPTKINKKFSFSNSTL